MCAEAQFAEHRNVAVDVEFGTDGRQLECEIAFVFAFIVQSNVRDVATDAYVAVELHERIAIVVVAAIEHDYVVVDVEVVNVFVLTLQ